MALCRISGSGLVTTFGVGKQQLWRALTEARSGIRSHDPGDGAPPLPAARLPEGTLPNGPTADRTLALLDLALDDLAAEVDLAALDRDELGVCLGTTQGTIHSWQRHQQLRNRDPNHRPPQPGLFFPGRHLADRLGARGPLECPSMACTSGTAAVALGAQWIRDGLCRAVVAGGVDAYSSFVHRGFASLKALAPDAARPFDRDRAGLTMGEGAALVLLQAEKDAPYHGPGVCGWGSAADANHLTGPDPEGGGVARAVLSALRMAGLKTDAVDYVSAHGTGTVYNDRMEGQALLKVFGERVARLPVDSIKGAVGHTMGAAGTIEVIHCLQVMRHGTIPPTCGLTQLDPEIPLDVTREVQRTGRFQTALSTSSGFGGFNATIILKAE